VTAERPAVAQNRPSVHGDGALEPTGQNDPTGHNAPTDDMFVAPQKRPAVHAVGVLDPSGQKLPVGHTVAFERYPVVQNEPASQ
jgi:hypothetical protein